jgi:serine/threonine protein phosphatase 1
MSRTIAIGDIHGCASALDRLLYEIQPTQTDTIIGLGDYVDRGMESARVIETLVDLVSRCRLIPLIGNHELMMYKALQGNQKDFEFWYQHGGSATLASYGGNLEQMPQHHLTFLSHCLRFYETDTHFFVHANYDEDVPLDQQSDEALFWRHVNEYPPGLHQNGKIAYVGHTPQTEGDVLDFGHLKVIDTFCYGDQWLSAVDVHSGVVYQANTRGDFRTEQLPPQESYYVDPPEDSPPEQ